MSSEEQGWAGRGPGHAHAWPMLPKGLSEKELARLRGIPGRMGADRASGEQSPEAWSLEQPWEGFREKGTALSRLLRGSE